ncbi:MAG: rRNA maturation RNase YbeY [Bacilli bacterium]|nr:rRNA maturation RNase YbeY [Bacilli bacterium]
MEIINEVDQDIKELKEVEKFIDYVLQKLKLEDVIFDIIIVDNFNIKKINKEYRNIDNYTDVISFALEDFCDIKTEVRILGDIYISIDKAKEQAKDYEHSLLRELSFLSIHGLLHLLGYDHEQEEEEKEMFELQERLLDEYGIKR